MVALPVETAAAEARDSVGASRAPSGGDAVLGRVVRGTAARALGLRRPRTPWWRADARSSSGAGGATWVSGVARAQRWLRARSTCHALAERARAASARVDCFG